MNTKFCTCSFYKTKHYGLQPANHAWSCSMFKQETNICKEEWPNEDDKIRYDEKFGKKENGKKA